MSTKGRLLGLVLALASSVVAAQTPASPYPTRPVRLIVPYAAGGAADALARMMAQKLGPILGGSVIVEDRPGAGGVIGTDLVAKAPNDGYTLVWGGSAALAINVTLMKNLPYDPVADFAPVCRIASGPFVLAVAPGLGVHNLAELLALSKRRQLSYASAGNGTSSHISMELLKSRTGMKAEHVAYKGTGPAVTDVMGGHVDMLFESVGPLAAHIKGGKLVAIASTSPRRIGVLPEVPTFQEVGLPEVRVDPWMGLLVRAGTPPPIVKRLGDACKDIMATADTRDTIAVQNSMEPDYAGPDEFAAFVKSEIPKWAQLLSLIGAKAE